MKFLIEDSTLDISTELLNAIDYYMYNFGEYIDYELSDEPVEVEDFMNTCPVGSINFVHGYFEKHNLKIPAPLNIPKPLWKHSNLNPRLLVGEAELDKPMWVKSTEQFKHEHNGEQKSIPAGEWQVTDMVDILSEWRGFVFNDRLIDCKCYSGDWDRVPDRKYINKAIDLWRGAPFAYTIDVGVLKNKTCIIECHNFYSCGLYGFNFPSKYPLMLYSTYKFITNNTRRAYV